LQLEFAGFVLFKRCLCPPNRHLLRFVPIVKRNKLDYQLPLVTAPCN